MNARGMYKRLFLLSAMLLPLLVAYAQETDTQDVWKVPKESDYNHWEGYGEAGVNLMLTTPGEYDDELKTKWGYRMEFGARYYVTEKFFLSFGLGYEAHFGSDHSSSYGISVSSYSAYHALMLPLHIGVKLAPKIRIHAGPYFNYVVGGKTETTMQVPYPGKYSFSTENTTTKVADMIGYNRFLVGISLGIDFPYVGIEAGYGLNERSTSGSHEAYVQVHFVF